MNWLWIIGVILVLFLLFCLLRLGVLVTFDVQQVTAWVSVGPLKIQVAPQKPKKKEKVKKEKIESQAVLDKLKRLPKPTFDDLKTAYQALWPPMKRALKRVHRGIRIHPLQVSVTLAGKEDPAQAAKIYGYSYAAVWTGMPILEQLLVIPDPQIHIGLDFDAGETDVRGSVGISLRIGTLFVVGFGMGFPALRWFLKYRKKQKVQQKSQKDNHTTTEHQAA